MGWTALRLGEVCNNGAWADVGLSEEPEFGGLSAVIAHGDHNQLPPVLDSIIFDSNGDLGQTQQFGLLAYNTLRSNVFVLDTIMRQKDNSTLAAPLLHLRDADTKELLRDISFWNGRRIKYFPQHEAELFSLQDPHTLYVTCFNKHRDAYNLQYLHGWRRIYDISAVCSGVHCTQKAHKKLGHAKAIPRNVYLGLSMMVKLTCNILADQFLFNGARGVVRYLWYPDNIYDATKIPIVLVEFPDYTGPPWNPNHPKLLPVYTWTCLCDCKKCYRKGIPLVVSKADSTHSLQGAQVGDAKALKRIVITWNSAAEQKWANILYVAGSRAEDTHNIAITFDFTEEDMYKIGSSSSYKTLNGEMADLKTKAFNQRRQMLQKGIGTQENLLNLMKWLVEHIERKEIPDVMRSQVSACLNQWKNSLISKGVTF